MRKKAMLLQALGAELVVFGLLFLFIKIESLNTSLLFLVCATLAGVLLARSKRLAEALGRAFSQARGATFAFSLLLVVILPWLFLRNAYILHILIFSLIYIIAALGLNFQLGSLGMVNFAQSTFFGLGAYASALLTTRLGLPFGIGVLGGMVVTAFFGLLLGYPSLKTKSFYLSLVTIAFCYIAFLMVHNMQWTGGPDGVSGILKPKLFGFSLARSMRLGGIVLPGSLFYYYFVLVFVLAASLVAWRCHNSWLGLAWNAIREDEIASRCYGIDITVNKLLAFLFGSVFAGVSGSLYAHFVGFVSPENMSFSIGLLMVSMVILGGMDNIFGVIVGAVLLVLIPEKFRAFQDFRLLFYGLILIVMLLFRQQGLFPFRPRKYASWKELDHA